MLTIDEIRKFSIDPMIKLCFDYILPISKDRVLATHGREISLIDTDGNMIVTYDSIELASFDKVPDTSETFIKNLDGSIEACESEVEYIDDILIFLDDGLYGLMDYDGNIIVEAEYKSIKFISENEIEVTKV